MSTPSPKVFISYAHQNNDQNNRQDEQHQQRVLAFANQLRSDGVDIILDQHIGDPPQGWPLWMSHQLEAADIVLLIITATYSKRIQGKEADGIGTGSRFEGKLVYNAIHDNDSRNSKFLSVLFQQDNAKYIPLLLKGNNYYLVNDQTSYQTLLKRIFNHHQADLPPLGNVPNFPKQAPPDFFSSFDAPAANTDHPASEVNQMVKTAHLPTSNYDALFGRDSELQLLNNAWNDPHTRIVSLIAWGGVGKTALINEWLEQMNKQNYQGASHVLGYSFCSQGSDDDKQVSSDAFFTHMFRWLHYRGDIPSNEHNKGEVLAELLAEHKILLILDGLEPLQWPSSSPQEIVGQLKDSAIKALLCNLADKNPGLVVISSRLALTDLTTKQAVHSEALQCLSPSAGIALLARAGVTGPTQDMQDAVDSSEGHALSLNLLASYLVTVHQGDVRRRDLINSSRNERTPSAKANNMLHTYVDWLTSSDAQDDMINAIALNYLYIVGLFDRPVTPALQEALLAGDMTKQDTEKSTEKDAKKGIDALSKPLSSASHEQKQLALNLLRQLKLLDPPVEDKYAQSNDLHSLDCHPLIRDYFGNRLKTQHRAQYTAAHTRLYHYYQALPEEQLPDTLDAMQPLFAAVVHGCKADLQQQALDEVYWPRIKRENEHFSTAKLGAFAADLACIAQFFEQTWQTPSQNLTEDDKSIVLNWAAFGLQGLSRLAEAVEPFQAVLNRSLQRNNYQDAAVNASNLSELHLNLGNIEQALVAGEQAVHLSNKSGDWSELIRDKTTHADALLHHDQRQAAWQLLTDAEQLQQQWQPDYRYLYSKFGFRYCEFLLAQADWQAVITRASLTLDWATQENLLLDISLDQLSLGNAYLQQAQQQTDETALATAKRYLEDAVLGLHKAGRIDNLPKGLLARANYYTLTRDHQAAWQDLQQAYEISYFGSMRLFLSDYQLLAAENLLAQLADPECSEYFTIADDEPLTLTEAELHTHLKQHLQAAATLIEATEYLLKTPALNRLYYQYNEQTLAAAAFNQALVSDPQLQAGQAAIVREQTLIAANTALYTCRKILQDVKTGELAVTEPLKAEFLQQLSELKQQVDAADDDYRRPILAELAAAGLLAELTGKAELVEYVFNEQQFAELEFQLIALKKQQLRENAIQLKDELEMNRSEQFQSLKIAASEIAEQYEVGIEEAMILRLMQEMYEQEEG